MGVPRNIFAYTAPGFDPEYLSINIVDGKIVVTVRSPKNADGSGGETAAMTLSVDQVIEVPAALRRGLMQLADDKN